jgi:hypothetical protein
LRCRDSSVDVALFQDGTLVLIDDSQFVGIVSGCRLVLFALVCIAIFLVGRRHDVAARCPGGSILVDTLTITISTAQACD